MFEFWNIYVTIKYYNYYHSVGSLFQNKNLWAGKRFWGFVIFRPEVSYNVLQSIKWWVSWKHPSTIHANRLLKASDIKNQLSSFIVKKWSMIEQQELLSVAGGDAYGTASLEDRLPVSYKV